MNYDLNNESKENKLKWYSFYDWNHDSELVFFSWFESYSNMKNMKNREKKKHVTKNSIQIIKVRYNRNTKRMKSIILFNMFLRL